MKLTDEQYRKIGSACGFSESYAAQEGERIAEAIAPLFAKEMLGPVTGNETRQLHEDFTCEAHKGETSGWDCYEHALANFLASRLSRYAPELVDPAIEAVAKLMYDCPAKSLIPDGRVWVNKVVNAVRKADSLDKSPSPLVVTRGGEICADQTAALDEFKKQCGGRK